MVSQLTCKKCKGTDFNQKTLSVYICKECGTEKSISHKRLIVKKKKAVLKENISTDKNYRPITIFCENCGEKLERMGSPKDYKRFKNKWEKHRCLTENTDDNVYF